MHIYKESILESIWEICFFPKNLVHLSIVYEFFFAFSLLIFSIII